jgi:hypothetical protein
MLQHMTANEEKLIRRLNTILSQPIKITLIETAHKNSKALIAFCEKLSQLVQNIQLIKEGGDDHGAPMIGIGSGIRYQGVPTGTELEPFLEALAFNDSGLTHISESLKNRLHKIELPAVLSIYVAPQCKFCPQVVRQVLPLSHLNDHIQTVVIDCTQFPELMQEKKIQAVPTLILDDQFRWTGSVDLDEVVGLMIDRDPSLLGASSLEMILKDGNATQLAGMMLEKDQIFPAFYDVLTHPKWPVRLGAMVVMEELIDKRPDLAIQVLNPLWQRFYKVSEQIKGDILYIFGEIGNPQIIPQLQSVLNGEFGKDVKEAANEALKKVKNRA